MFSFLETICIEDGLIKNLPYHKKRVHETFESFYPDINPINIEEILTTEMLPAKGVYRCRIIYEETIKSFEFIPYQEKPIAVLKIINTGEFDYGFKWADRSYFEHTLKENKEVDEVIF